MIKPVEIVEVNKIIPVYKNGEEANSIQVINFKFKNGDECGYNVIAQKGLYEIGSKACYIQPDYCLSDIGLFNSFTMPDNDPKKSRLGKNNRVRAIKFNFSFANSTDPIYSFGVLLPKSEVDSFIGKDSDTDDITEILGITKYEEPETAGFGLIAGDFPSFLYKTDEENCIEENQLIATDKGYVKVKDVCKTPEDYLVLSFNHETEMLEYKEIENVLIRENNNDWYEITLDDDTSLILTSNHEVFLPELNCYRPVKDLKIDNFLYKTE